MSDILLDGATTELASANMQVTYNFSVEAVSEFKVMTNTFDAQFGSASGGVVNLVSKQGTNNFHGSAYDLLKNRVLDANSWLNDYQNAVFGPNSTTKPLDTQNDFGASVGGPVRVPWLYNGKDKTFFFFNYEGFRQVNGGTSLAIGPTQAMLGGDFSSLLNPDDRQRPDLPGPHPLRLLDLHRRQPGTALPGLSGQQNHRGPGSGLCRRIQGHALRPLQRHQPLLQHQ